MLNLGKLLRRDADEARKLTQRLLGKNEILLFAFKAEKRPHVPGLVQIKIYGKVMRANFALKGHKELNLGLIIPSHIYFNELIVERNRILRCHSLIVGILLKINQTVLVFRK